ncbi:MAG: 16S rRNA (cytosine(1402)-N(4))-methyltransferase RsmH [Solirubrobacterales bacterium]
MAFRGLYEHSLDSKDRLTIPARFRAALAEGVVLSKGFDPCVWVHTTSEFEGLSERFLAPHSPFGQDARRLRRRFHGGAFDEKVDSAGRVRIPGALLEHAGLSGRCVVVGAGEYLEIWDAEAWARQDAEPRRRGAADRRGPGGGWRMKAPARSSASATATLTYMPADHQPVLEAELVEALGPREGETAVDCTFGAGGHARAVAERLGSQGTLICIDRDPSVAGRFAELAAEVECSTRFLRADFAEGLRRLRGEGLAVDIVYMDLGISSTQLDAWARGFSYSYDAPLDMRMDPEAPFSAADLLNEWPESRIAQVLRRFGEERHAKRIARAIVARRPLASTSDLVAAVKAGIPDSARFGGGHPARRTFQAVRIAVNGELDSLERALPAAWDLLRPGGRFGAISFHSLEDRLVKRFLSERARGCVCPPELPVCVCGHQPEAELLTRRAVAPGAEEVARNPRSRSAHLRAALKLASAEEAS